MKVRKCMTQSKLSALWRIVKIAFAISLTYVLLMSLMDSQGDWSVFFDRSLKKSGIGGVLIFVYLLCFVASREAALARGYKVNASGTGQSWIDPSLPPANPLNPANGLPMSGSQDVMGNSYGDNHRL